MENRIGNSDGVEIPKKSRSLDLKSLYESRISKESQHSKDVKRKISKEDGDAEKSYKRKKSSKTVSISSLKNVDNSKRSVDDEVSNGIVSSGSHDLKDTKLGSSHISGSGFNGISFSLDDIVRIPKRKRGFVGRKKVEVSQLLKPSGHSCSKASVVDQEAKVIGDASATKDRSTEDLDCQVEPLKDFAEQVEPSKDFAELVEPSKLKSKKGFDNSEENRNGELNSARHLEEEGEHANRSVVNDGETTLKKEKRNSKSNSNWHAKEGGHASYAILNNGDSSLKKPNRVSKSSLAQCLKEEDGGASHSEVNKSQSSLKKSRRNNSKRKDSTLDKRVIAKEAELSIDTSVKACDNLLEDEENLEENAAMMLSSRFDPSCTGFSSNGKSIPPMSGVSFLLSSGRDFGSPESSLLDAAGRALRPRANHKERGHSRKRRHYYELFSRDLDGYWVLNRRIKVFWPLDQCWYYGLVDDYDKEKKLHHVKYDDRDEEWINLENERFKLLLLPGEVPGKAGRRRSRIRKKSLDGKGSLKSSKEKETRNLITEDENCMGSYMDSEPIISWLARSARVKSSPFTAPKKQRKSDPSLTFQPPFLADEVGDGHGCLNVDSKNNKLPSKVELLDRFSGGGTGEESASALPNCSKESKLPIVYYRRRFRKTGTLLSSTSSGNPISSSTHVASLAPSIDGFLDLEEHGIFLNRQVPDGDSGSIGNAGISLTSPLIESRQVRFKLSFAVPSILNYACGAEDPWLIHAMFLLHYGTLMTMWPSVHLEMLFVDNVVGLRYFMFQGCLKQAVSHVFLVLTLFHQPNEQGKCADLQLPVTSIRFKFSCIQNLRKQFLFAFYNFTEVKNSIWMYMDSRLKRHCLLTRQLPLSECTYDNIRALRHGGKELFTTSACWGDSSTKGLHRMSGQGISMESARVKFSQFSSNLEKQRSFPPFALSFAAAPSFFISLHLKLLMEHSMAGLSFQGRDSTMRPESDDCLMADDSCSSEYCMNKDSEVTCENNVSEFTLETNAPESTFENNVMLNEAASDGCLPVAKSVLEATSPSVCDDGHQIRSPQIRGNGDLNVTGTSASSRDSEEIGGEAIAPFQKWQCHTPKSEQSVLSPRPSGGHDRTDTAYHSPLNGIRVEIPTFDQFEKHVDREYHSAQRSTDLSWNMNGGIIPSPNPTAPRSTWNRNRSSSSSFGYLAHGWSDGKADIVHNNFGNGPKKPRTQVSYSLPYGGFDYSSKNRGNHQKGLPHMRIRRANEKRLPDVSRGSNKNLELLSCDANVLITIGDKGWRECGAQVVLELFDHNEWKLAVKLSGATRYSYKAHQFLQPGSTNRYTHAMMWKGGKDWILEFPDRSQWALFKEMHEECYNRNIRAASVKNIPIPGVRLVEESDDNGTEIAFVRSSKYFRQVETDVEMALDSSRVFYDMDSDDEQWLMKIHSSSETDYSDLSKISEELFEKMMDIFEKAAYSQQQDQFTFDEIEDLMAGVGPMEAIKVIYAHWRWKRQRKGMPLIRHLQPPLWERYQQQLKEWELAMSRSSSTLPNGCQGRVAPVEKPPMFAFCLKPRGLEVPYKGSKHRSHRKFSVSGKNNNTLGDHDVFHPYGRRLNGFAFGDDKVLYPAHNYDYVDDSPLSQSSPRVFSPRMFSPRDAGSLPYFSMGSDGYDRNQYQKLRRSKSKKFGMFESSYDSQMVASYHPRLMGKRNGIHRWNTGYSEWPSQRHFYSDGSQRNVPEQLDCSDLDEFRLRDASGAAQHARNMAKLKREKAQRLLYRADLVIHKAVNALMIAEAMKASSDDINSDG